MQWIQELLGKLQPFSNKQVTHLRKTISIDEDPAVTLRYLRTGEFAENLMFQFSLHKRKLTKCFGSSWWILAVKFLPHHSPFFAPHTKEQKFLDV